MKRQIINISKKFFTKLGEYLIQTHETPYFVFWFFGITIIVLCFMLLLTRRVPTFVWWTTEETGVSNWCYEDNGKYCLVPKKVNQFEKTREEIK